MATLGNSVTIAQLASMMNTSQDVQAICTSANINKWSKCKPIDYPKTSPLNRTTNEFKGTQDQVGDGIIYGLKAGAAIQRPEELHSATWEYVGRPKGGLSSPYRVDDFWGYEYDYKGPTLKGSGLVDGERIRYDTANKVVNLVWRTDLTSVVDLAEVISAYQGSADYSKVYLCVMVGSYIRCCVNNTAGGIYPILHNGTYCTSFTIPAVSPIYGYNEDTLRPITLFFANETALTLTPAMKTEWVDPFGLNFSHPLISCPEQVNKQVKFVRQLMEYIKSFSVTKYTYRNQDQVQYTFVKGDSWNSAAAYRVRWSVKTSAGATVPCSSVSSIPLTTAEGTYDGPALFELIGNYVQFPTGQDQFVITGAFEYQASSGSAWTATSFNSSVTVNY